MHYLKNTQGLIFVVDSNDSDRIADAMDELHLVSNEDELRDVVLLIFANKKDLPNATCDNQETWASLSPPTTSLYLEHMCHL